MKTIVAILALALSGCARTWVNYPPQIAVGKDGVSKVVAARAIELNGSDFLGHSEIEVTRNGVRILAAGGIDNSTSTRAGYHALEHGITTAGTVAGLAFAASAASANSAASAASNQAASKASAANAASANATKVRLAEIAAQAALVR